MMQPSFALPEAPYTWVNLTFLVVCALVLVLAGILVVDLVEHQRTFATPHFVSGSLLDSILGLFEKSPRGFVPSGCHVPGNWSERLALATPVRPTRTKREAATGRGSDVEATARSR